MNLTREHLALIVQHAVENERRRSRRCATEISVERVKGFIDGYIAALAERMEQQA